MKTLWEEYVDTEIDTIRIPLKIYDSKSKKLLCSDYGALSYTPENKYLDDLEVVSVHKVNGYRKVYVRNQTVGEENESQRLN